MNRPTRPFSDAEENPPSVDELWAPLEEQLVTELRGLASGQGGNAEQWYQRDIAWIHSCLDVFIACIHVRFKEAEQMWRKRCTVIRQDLANYRTLLAQLERQWAEPLLEPAPSGTAILGYGAFYTLLVIGAIALFMNVFRLVYAEQPRWVALLSSLGLAAPSYLIANAYHHRSAAARDRLLKLLRWVGGASFGIALPAYVWTRDVVLHATQSTTSFTASTLFNAGISEGFDAVSVLSRVLLLFLSIVELCFAGLLAIQIRTYLTRSHSPDLLAQQIAEVRELLVQRENDEERAIACLAQVTMTKAMWEGWRRERAAALQLRLDAIVAQHREALIEQFVHVFTLSPTTLQNLITAMRNGNGGISHENDHLLSPDAPQRTSLRVRRRSR